MPGSWPSPISAADAVATGRTLDAVGFAGDELWWSESRPSEGGRVCVCRQGFDSGVEDLLPVPWNARTRVHEYGGTSWLPLPGGALVFAELRDQRLYRLESGGVPTALTPEPIDANALRYADFQLDGRRNRLIAVRESHRGDGTYGTVDRTLVAIPLDGSAAADADAVVDLLAGRSRVDFLAGPRLSAGGGALVWYSWNHPDMPWDATVVHLAAVEQSGSLGPDQQIAGGDGISAVEPGFLPDGSVLLISDESGWWQPYLVDARTGQRRRPVDRQADFSRPPWDLGRRSWGALPGGRLLATPDSRPAIIDTLDGSITELDPAWNSVTDLATDRVGRIALIVGGDTVPDRIVLVAPNGRRQTLRETVDVPLPTGYAPIPQVRTVDGVHAIVYPPTSPGYEAAPRTAPMILVVHGGPTSAHPRTLSARTAYFTSRGFVVASVDYRGSTGYGRAYRDALKGHWAEYDIDDVMTVAQALLADGTAGSALVRGGSAGGLTVLGALTRPEHPFAAGVSAYGIGDLAALATSTHDFESRYLDQLIGTDPRVWADRSPLRHADRLATPVLLLQGGRDAVVPPSQAEKFAEACAAKNVPYALIVFPEEGHGFRSAPARTAALEAELAFYGQILGFSTPGVDPVQLL